MSVLSELRDGAGYFYGFVRGDSRRIDVKEFAPARWSAWVAGIELNGTWQTKRDAEEAAVEFIQTNEDDSE